MCGEQLRYIKMTKMTTHACKRFWDYSEEIPEIAKKNWTVSRLRKLIGKRIADEIKKGLVVDRTGAFHIPIGWGLHSAITFCPKGYLVLTVHKNKKNIDINKLRTKFRQEKNPH